MTVPALLAQLYRAGGHHGVRWGAVVFGLILLGLLVTIIVLLVRGGVGSGATSTSRRTAEAILSDRFARGEITEEEFIRRRNALRS